MNIQSVAIVSGTEADPAETVVKAAVSAEAMEDGSLAVKTGTAEDLAAVTARTEENGAAATKRQRTVNTPGTERREK